MVIINRSVFFIFICLRLSKNARLFGSRCQNQQVYEGYVCCLDVKTSLILTKYSKRIVNIFHCSRVTSHHTGVIPSIGWLQPVGDQVGVQQPPPAPPQRVPAVLHPAGAGWGCPTDHTLQGQGTVLGHCQALGSQRVKDVGAT